MTDTNRKSESVLADSAKIDEKAAEGLPIENRSKPNSVISFTIALKTGLGLNSRDGWQARHKRTKKERQQIALAWLVFVGKKRVQLPTMVTLTRIKPVGKLLDDDNLRGSLKGVRDQVAKELGVDDGDVGRIRFEYAQGSGPWSVRVEIS